MPHPTAPRRSTAADRAALARRRTSSRPVEPRDPCPLCASDLGGPRATTRRLVVFSSVPGTFRWQCPDCSGTWVQGEARTRRQPEAAMLAASAAKSPAGTAAP